MPCTFCGRLLKCFVSAITLGFSERYRMQKQQVLLAKLARQLQCAALKLDSLSRVGCFRRLPALCLDHARRGYFDVPGQTAHCKRLDAPHTRIKLPPCESKLCRTREGMMVVVPGFPQSREHQPEVVGTVLVMAGKGTAPIGVAERINGPGKVARKE